MTMNESAFGEGLARGARRAAIHLIKAGVEILRGLEGFFDELSAATRGEDREGRDDEKGPERISLD